MNASIQGQQARPTLQVRLSVHTLVAPGQDKQEVLLTSQLSLPHAQVGADGRCEAALKVHFQSKKVLGIS